MTLQKYCRFRQVTMSHLSSCIYLHKFVPADFDVFFSLYTQQVFDNIMKRVSYRRQKRWWNAYLLFYTRLDVEEDNLCNSLNELSLGKL